MPNFIKETILRLRSKSGTRDQPAQQRVPPVNTEDSAIHQVPQRNDNHAAGSYVGFFLVADTDGGRQGEPNPKPQTPQTSIILVHGIGGHWKRSWVLGEFSWIEGFLQPDLQGSNLRVSVWSYGYDSRTATNSVANIEDVANALLDRIYRETNGPVILVAHSLGGLVAKKAITLAHTDDDRYGGLLKRIRGCVFLGVPHRGADKTWWKTVPGTIMKYSTVGFMGNNNFADSLSRESDTWRNISNDFVPRTRNLIAIHSFYETRKIGPVLVVDKDSARMGLEKEICHSTDSDHVTIIRFGEDEYQRYRPVGDAIVELVRKVEEEQTGGRLPPCELPAELEIERREFLKRISFPEMQLRENKVETAFAASYKWFGHSDEFETWLTSPDGKLLIKGKPGCGKSTFMKHFYRRFREGRGAAGPAVCGFFFNGRGVPIERSVDGMLRTLLHQLVSQVPLAFKSLIEHHRAFDQANQFRQGSVDWATDTLKKMFHTAIHSPDLSAAFIFIDALDEGEGFLPADVFDYVETVVGTFSDTKIIKIWLSSRPDNFVNRRTRWTTLDLGERNSGDIQAYATGLLTKIAKDCDYPDLRYDTIVPQLLSQILEHAQGVFLWAKLVIDQLRAAMYDGESVKEIQSMLSKLCETADDLWDLFRSVLQKVKRNRRAEAVRLLKIVLAAARPLSLEELAHAMALSSPNPPGNLDDFWDPERADQLCEEMKRKVINWCGGLVEVVYLNRTFYIGPGWSRKGRYFVSTQVQFLHQSVKDFCQNQVRKLEEFGIGDVGDSPSFEATSHELMFGCCLRYLRLPAISEHMAHAETPARAIVQVFGAEADAFQDFWAHAKRRFPFLLYSPLWVAHAENLIRLHPDKMGRRELEAASQLFMESRWYPYRKDWKQAYAYGLYSATYGDQTVAEQPYSNLLCFSARRGFIFLFRKLLSHSGLELDHPTLDNCLAIACGCFETRKDTNKTSAQKEMIQLLIERGANMHAKISKSVYESALSSAVYKRGEAVVQALIEASADVSMGSPGETDAEADRASWLMLAAAREGWTATLSLLMDRGADVNIQEKTGRCRTALITAAKGGMRETAAFLLARGADVNLDVSTDEYGYGSALIAAAEGPSTAMAFYLGSTAVSPSGTTEMVALLVNKGADINLRVRNGGYGTALIAAAANRETEVVAFLLDRGADVNLQAIGGDRGYGTALIAAAAQGHKAVVELLVDRGADVNLQATAGKYATALIAAAVCGREETAKSLVDRGADLNLRAVSGRYGTALIAAAAEGRGSMFAWLLNQGASMHVQMQSIEYGSVSAAAVGRIRELSEGPGWKLREQKTFIRWLMALGVDVKAALPGGQAELEDMLSR
ncbi:uncharacterized protein B0T15DRAFT_515318 [Chaetomium strumarium]|uniref:NACHT domain-containing protein n=1 Tax=Chaetomium strumarium TaxID=1170767 RepID=A0AAJ0H041_9PEZI|nr:hypothetical protein B0T15DRAFT_515318 [Chaetomium strumarium]